MRNDVLLSVVIDVLPSDVIEVVRYGVAAAVLFCWCSEMLFFRECSLQYCSFSNVVQSSKLGRCDDVGRIQSNV